MTYTIHLFPNSILNFHFKLFWLDNKRVKNRGNGGGRSWWAPTLTMTFIFSDPVGPHITNNQLHHQQHIQQQHQQIQVQDHHHHHHQNNQNQNQNQIAFGMMQQSPSIPALVSSTTNNSSKRPSEPSMELANARNNAPSSGPETAKAIKTLRRLAQNREAARKSRLRKKAYVQQLESSRIKLTQLEQELQRARTQYFFFTFSFLGHVFWGDFRRGARPSSGHQQYYATHFLFFVFLFLCYVEAAVFDMEYARWLEVHHRLMCELRAAVQEHLPENELRLYVDNCLAHYDEIMNLKGMVAKTDVFHLVSGLWKSPAERCFLWLGGFRPSELIKVILSQIEPLTEQQILGICGLQQSTQEAEDALSQGLEALNQSILDTIASDSLSCPPNMANYMGQMAVAMNKLSTLEGFVRQADNLRHQTIHRLNQILTTRQAARCLLAIAEYFHRLRALSSLWMARPRQE
ncbi:transcription factor TGA10 [Citrus sinensis]|uniref:Transcription factor TGA10 n=1 Tax=Citrus sinensis TaxID=2711 RepID=A0ACB8LAT4_CITSI|nr:transcription factor TGA10 [Citrus sinensis]